MQRRSASSVSVQSPADPLMRLIAMRTNGEISEDEFRRAKQNIVNDGTVSNDDETGKQHTFKVAPAKQESWLNYRILGIAMLILGSLYWLGREPSTGSALSGLPELSTQSVSASEYGSDWPFAFQKASIECRLQDFGGMTRPVVTMLAQGRTYGLNGVARGTGQYLDYSPLLPSDPLTGAFTVGVGTLTKLVTRGVALCR